MPTLAIEISDAGFRAATCGEADPRLIPFNDKNGAPDWPGFAYHDGQKLLFGRAAEDFWFVHPRRVIHTFWERLAHEPATFNVPGKLPSFSELAFHFLRQFSDELKTSTGPAEKVLLSIPGVYLKDSATEDEKVGLLLGMASELALPLAGIIDGSLAALCDPRSEGFNVGLPVIVVDVQLEGTDLALFSGQEEFSRRGFIHLHNSGFAQLFKHLTGTMGNRFLRHSAFDILEDGRIEQIFYRQTRDFVLTRAPEFRFQINTAKRNYEMLAKNEQLVADSQAFVATIVQGLQSFAQAAMIGPDACTLALTHRAQAVPGLQAKLQSVGYRRRLRLADGAAACGASWYGARRISLPAEIADVPVITSVPTADVQRSMTALWESRLLKAPGDSRPAPTHVVLDGIGHAIGSRERFLIGSAMSGVDLPLPESLHASADCVVPLLRDNRGLWFVDPNAPGAGTGENAARIPVDAGDRLAIRCGSSSLEMLFVRCDPSSNGTHR